MQATALDESASPPREFSLMPFWFWNDRLEEGEILRQIADFEAHGVYGFVIHPRVGLPRDIGWMSESLLHFMRIAIEEAARRDMRVILYDEGMYPSGSASGRVVAENPALACRCLAMLGEAEPLPRDAVEVAHVPRADGQIIRIIDRPSHSYIRGLHYVDEDTNIEDEPPAGDILNPLTAQAVLRLVYEPFFRHFGQHFGNTILGIFTDEPNALGRSRDPQLRPGTTNILPIITEMLRYDFTPHLPALWFDEPNAAKFRADYDWAIRRRLEQTWYRPLSEWCEGHGIALCGHPDRGDEIGVQRFFHFPGQDLVWRWVLPDHPSALEGPESTQAKCSSSAMIHAGRRRNSNEFCGAYGNETTFEEFQWLANWCLVRGVNLLIPHAFYYSVRGPRRDERPPQVGGVGCSWWKKFKPFADRCRLLSWLNTDSQHICDIAILTTPDHCPWRAAKVCYENQMDFNYVDVTMLHQSVTVDAEGLHMRGMSYRKVIIDSESPGDSVISAETEAALAPLLLNGGVISFISPTPFANALHTSDERGLVSALSSTHGIRLATQCRNLRVRELKKHDSRYLLFFNEGSAVLNTEVLADASGGKWLIGGDSVKQSERGASFRMTMSAGGVALLRLPESTQS